MISLKKYLDSAQSPQPVLGASASSHEGVLSAALAGYASALIAMGQASLVACPGVSEELKRNLEAFSAKLSCEMSCAEMTATSSAVRDELQAWGNHTAMHYRQKAGEVKELLIAMARAAESVGVKDIQCAGQIREVTNRLQEIASLDDITEIRASIKKSAAELRTSIERMTTEGKALVEELRRQVSSCRAKLEEAEEIAYRDALTGVRSRLNVESQIESRIATGTAFCVALLDIDDFKAVNDEYGHVTGDELLKQFANEVRSVCRVHDVIGRWGGDEFIVLFDGCLDDAERQKERLQAWVCGSYTVHGNSGPTKLSLSISIGLAEHLPGESRKELIARADDAMYEHKGISRPAAVVARR